MEKHEVERVNAVERYRRGEDPRSIAASYGKSIRWLYKWVERENTGGSWFADASRRPHKISRKTPETIAELIVSTRARLEREGCFSGAQSIIWELEDLGVEVPAERTVNRILHAHGCFDPKSPRYTSKERRYPAPIAVAPGDVHQSDFVGPRYIKGDGRFYSLNTTDVVTMRARGVPLRSRAADDVIGALWHSWQSLGIPKYYQLDNELVFWGSRRYPRGLSQVIRLCLLLGVEPIFIPPGEPWRNSIIEKFNDHWQQKFLRRVQFESFEHLTAKALEFDGRHNSKWRYSRTGGKTPNDALRAANTRLTFPTGEPPRLPLPKPTTGRIRLVRFIRSELLLDIFGERFRLPRECTYEYVTAVIDVKARRLTAVLDGREVAAFDYA